MNIPSGYLHCRSWGIALLAGLMGTAVFVQGADTPLATPAQPLPRDHWAVVSSGQASTLAQVIWTGSQFLAVGGDVVMNSPDGLKWTAQHLGITDSLFGINYNGLIYTVVGGNGTVFTSPDLNTWTQGMTSDNARLSSVFDLGNEFFALGDHTAVFSQNGRDWHPITLLLSGSLSYSGAPQTPAVSIIPNANFRHGAKFGTQYVMADDDKGIWISNGIINWTKALSTTGRMADVATNGKLLVAVGEAPNNVYTSSNGINWLRRDANISPNLSGVAWSGGQFVAVGDNGAVFTSPDGMVWVAQTADTKRKLTSVAGNGKIFVAVTDSGAVLAAGWPAIKFNSASLADLSPPPSASTATTATGPLDQWTVVNFADGHWLWQVNWLGQQFAAVGNTIVLTSPDGVLWTSHPLSPGQLLCGIASNGTITIGVGEKGLIITSTDFDHWTVRTSGTSERLMSVYWVSGQFWALGDNGLVMTSSDGITWASLTVSSDSFHHGIWTGTQFVVATYQGVKTSPDGVRWRNAAYIGRMITTAGNGNTFIAVGNAPNSLLVSKDSSTWNTVAATTADLNGAVWDGHQFIIVGSNGTIMSSPDGLVWTAQTSGANVNLLDAAEHNGVVVVVSENGTILTNKKMARTARPEISLAPGAPGSVPEVMLISATAGAKIYYTFDGTEPVASSTPYSVPFSPAFATTIKARAFKDGLAPSDVAIAQFTPGG